MHNKACEKNGANHTFWYGERYFTKQSKVMRQFRDFQLESGGYIVDRNKH
jgi:hypothetical protein